MTRLRATRRAAPTVARIAASAAIAAAAILGGCGTTPPAAEATNRMALVVPASPPTALEALRREVQRLGGAITAETANSFTVDFGVQTRRVAMPTAHGLWGTRLDQRETEVHSIATYAARATPDGTLVSVSQTPVYWHPDEHVWLPGPRDVAAGTDAIRDVTSPR